MSTYPPYFQYDEFKTRQEKLLELEKLSVDPYPHTFTPEAKASKLHLDYEDQAIGDSEAAASGTTPYTSFAGRLTLFRAMGKNAFGQLQDDTGRLQVMFNKELSKVEGFHETEDLSSMKFIEKKLDLGDILGIEGHLFRTHKGELTIFVKKVKLLTKALLPLPDKHSGLADKGLRYRKRWLDLISSKEVMDTFKTRSHIIRFVRDYFSKHHFLEVETPILQSIYGGAEARPFTTKLNALNQEMFLRIALEIPLKKLLVGGFDRVFEIGKVFRNEGIDKTHNPEFTMLEAYGAYMDYHDMMALTENLFAAIAMSLFGTTHIGKRLDKQGNPHEIDVKTPWIRISMKDSIHKYAHIDIDKHDDNHLRKLLLDLGTLDPKDIKAATRGKLTAYLFEELVEQHLIQPHHIIDHPIETTPLCKLHRDPKHRKAGIVERFETFILGFEFCNSYTELNDPILQRKLLEDQMLKKAEGNEEAHPMDEEFLEAICQGMPPAGGLGIGLDRLTMLFTGQSSIRDVLFFPLMRLEE